MKMKRFIAFAVTAALTFTMAVSAFAADLTIVKGDSIDGVGANEAEWPWALSADGTAIEMTRGDQMKDQILVDFNLPSTFDASGYDYLLADMYFSTPELLNYVEHAWFVIASNGDVDNNNLRLTAFGYALDSDGAPASDSKITTLNAGEWYTVAFPLKGSYAWDSHVDAFDASAVNKLRFQFMYGGNALFVPADGTISIKNIRFSNSETGGEEAAPAENTGTTETAEIVETTDNAVKTNPPTGDYSGIILSLSALLLTGAVSAFVIIRKRSRA